MKKNDTDIIKAHEFCKNNRPALKNDRLCGCFYCLPQIFDPKEIKEWIVQKPAETKGSAICPYCGIDSIIPESSGYPITKEFLAEMEKYWFGCL